MPPRDPRFSPALDEASPADSAETADWERIGEPRLVLFGDGLWHQVELRAQWTDRTGRLVIKLEWYTPDGDAWAASYLYEAGKVQEA